MFEDEQVLKWCIENNVSVTQYFFMFLLIKQDFNKPFHESLAAQYIKRHGKFNRDEVEDLIERGFIKDLNRKGENRPEFYMIEDEIVEIMKVTETMAEELWSKYPPTFELSNGAKFIARHAGVLGDKETALKVYMKRIRRSKKKHKFVLEMLDKYLSLVEETRLNSMKLGDWIANEMWDSVEKMEEASNDYGIDIK